ncbi:Predicted membrane protein [Nocardia otitidiscaviarum]|nr:Predicted membrane protein [Nocardia otitidiscaviarum]
MALSCYLLQNILGVIASRTVLTRPEVAVLDPLLLTGAAFLGVSAVLIAFACLWLRFFPRGPFELLWTWSYRKLARE